MIISFHYIYYFGIDFLKKIIGTNVLIACEEIEIMPNEQELENSIKFDPPVYRQRYGRVFDTLIDERWRTKITKLCDFGCAEFGLFVFLKGLNRLNHIFLVDIDEELLKDYIRRVHPLTIEYLRRREQQLQVSVFAGSVADPDYNILNVDVVTAIELIEHLYPDTLEAFPYNVFYYIHPKIVIITTPNADFNILFSSNNKRFRHYDHKFEWTREQFENWANNIISRFPDYVVTFTGIGEGPEHTKHLGECSQMALFIRKDVLNEDYILENFTKTCNCDFDAECKGQICDSIVKCSCTCSSCCPSFSWGICRYNSSSKIINIEMENNKDHPYNTFYKLIEKIEYPFEQDSRTEEEKMLDEFRYRIASMGQLTGRFFVDERERCEIPVIDLLYGNFGEDITGKEVARLLERHGYRIEECLIEETGLSEICVIYDPMDKLTSSSESSDVESSNNSVCYQVEDTLSDWDEPQNDPVLNVEECRKDIKG